MKLLFDHNLSYRLVRSLQRECPDSQHAPVKDSRYIFFLRMPQVDRFLIEEHNGFTLIKGKGSIRYYGKLGIERLVRIDYHGSREVPTGTCHAILSAAGLKHREE